jgi:hypothetical protein
MAIRIKSLLVSGPVTVPLNSGVTVRLSPGQSSAELADVEAADNPKVDKLLARGAIEVETVSEKKSESKDDDGATTSRKRRASSE